MTCAVIVPGHSQDVAHIHADDGTLVVYFTAYQNDWATSHGPERFHFMNAARGAGTGALFLRDRLNLWYTRGVGGADSVETLTALIRHTARDHDRLITFGSSMAGYAALLYGHLTEADLAVALVPQVRIGREATRSLGEYRFEADFEHLDQLAPGNPYYRLDDLLPGGGRSHFASVIGEGLDLDVRHQNLLRPHARIDDVRIPDADHGAVPARFIEHGLLREIVDRSPLQSQAAELERWIARFSLARPPAGA